MDIELDYAVYKRLTALSKPSPELGRKVFEQDGRRASFYVNTNTHKGVPVIQLHTIESIDKGGGRLALQAIISIADEVGYPIRLEAIPYATRLYKPPLTKEHLVAYYKSFGFKEDGCWLIRQPLTRDNY